MRRIVANPWCVTAALMTGLGSSANSSPLWSQPVTLESPRTLSPTGQVTIPNTHDYILRSAINGRTYRIQVALPRQYRDSATAVTRYPVMYLLDGEHELPLASLTFRVTNSGLDGGGSVVDIDPTQVIFVGIGYPPGKDPTRPPPGGGEVPYRRRDYSPPPFPKSNPDHKTWQSEQPWAGGAPLFLRVIKEELIPLIDRRYRTTADRGIHGHSMGGLFVTYALFTDPDLFSRYAITSPSFWWDGGSIFLREAEWSKKTKSLPKRVFLGVGGLEGAGEIADVWRMVSTLCQAADAGQLSGMRLTAEVFADEYHASAVPLSRALKALYPPFRSDTSNVRQPCAGR